MVEFKQVVCSNIAMVVVYDLKEIMVSFVVDKDI